MSSRRVAKRLGLAAHVAVITVAVSARAESAADPVRAEALFRQARTLIDDGDLVRGCPLFGESLRLEPAPGTVLNWADCEERLGHVAHAEQLYRQAAELLPPGDTRVAYAREHAAALSPRVPRVTFVRSPLTPPDALVREDAVEVRALSFGLPLPFEPGLHTWVLVAPGREPKEVSARLAEGERLQIAVEPGPEPRRWAVPLEKATGSAPRRAWGFGLIAGGGASAITGLVTGLVVLHEASIYEEHCTPGCDAEGRRAAETGRPWGIVSPIAIGIGALAVGTGIYLLATGPR